MFFRRLFAAAAVAVGVVVLAAPPASAGTVTSGYVCMPIGWPTMIMEITAPETATQGSTVTIEANITATIPSTGHPAGHRRGTLFIALDGAGSGQVAATGAVSPEIPEGAPFRLVGGKAQVTLPNTGDVLFKPAGYEYHNETGGVIFKCVVQSSQGSGVAAVTRVTPS